MPQQWSLGCCLGRGPQLHGWCRGTAPHSCLLLLFNAGILKWGWVFLVFLFYALPSFLLFLPVFQKKCYFLLFSLRKGMSRAQRNPVSYLNLAVGLLCSFWLFQEWIKLLTSLLVQRRWNRKSFAPSHWTFYRIFFSLRWPRPCLELQQIFTAEQHRKV